MENITYYITKLIQNLSLTSNSVNLQNSISTEIDNVNKELITTNKNILKTTEHIQYLEKTLADNESKYLISKQDLKQFEELLQKKKINIFYQLIKMMLI